MLRRVRPRCDWSSASLARWVAAARGAAPRARAERPRAVTLAEARAAAEAHAPEVTLSARRGRRRARPGRRRGRAGQSDGGAVDRPADGPPRRRASACRSRSSASDATAVDAARSDADAAGLDVRRRPAGEARWTGRWRGSISGRRRSAPACWRRRRRTPRAWRRSRTRGSGPGPRPRVDVLRTARRSRPGPGRRRVCRGGGARRRRRGWRSSVGAGDGGAAGRATGAPGLAPLADRLAARWTRAGRASGAGAGSGPGRRGGRARPRRAARCAGRSSTPTSTVNHARSDAAGHRRDRRRLVRRAGAQPARRRHRPGAGRAGARRDDRWHSSSARLAAAAGGRAIGAPGAPARGSRSLATDVLPALTEVRRMTEEGYRDGRIDLLRLLDAQRVLLESADRAGGGRGDLAAGARGRRAGGRRRAVGSVSLRARARGRRWRAEAAGLLALSPLGASACRRRARGAARRPEAADGPLRAGRERSTVTDAIELRGTVSPLPDRDAQVAPQVAGRIVQLLVREGDRVNARDSRWRASTTASLVDQASEARGGRREDARGAPQRRCDARARSSACSSTESPPARRSTTPPRALPRRSPPRTRPRPPRSGRGGRSSAPPCAARSPASWSACSARPGELVDGTPATPVVEVADPSQLELVSDATASDLVRIAKGAHADLTVAALAGMRWTGDRRGRLAGRRPRDRPRHRPRRASRSAAARGRRSARSGTARVVIGPRARRPSCRSPALRGGVGVDAEVVVCGGDGVAHLRHVRRGARGGGQGRGRAAVARGSWSRSIRSAIADGDPIEIAK